MIKRWPWATASMFAFFAQSGLRTMCRERWTAGLWAFGALVL